MQTRQATSEEIASQFQRSIASGDRVQFRHFVRERALRTARNGVRHIEYSRGKIVLVDGEPCIQTSKKGAVEKLTATIYYGEGAPATGTLFDLRIKSDYLK